MKRRGALSLMPVLIALFTSNALAQPPDEIQGVKAASKAFYDAIAIVDDGKAMERVWANTPYVTYVGPRSTSIIVGWEAQKIYWAEFQQGLCAAVSNGGRRSHPCRRQPRLGNRHRSRASANEGRHHAKGRLAGDEYLRKNRRSLADGLPSCPAQATVSKTMNARISADRNAAAEPAIRSVRFWTPIVVIAAALIGIVFVLDRPDARALAQQIKAEQIEQEDRALCGRIGKLKKGLRAARLSCPKLDSDMQSGLPPKSTDFSRAALT